MWAGKRIAALASALALTAAGVAMAAPGDTVYKGETAEGAKVKLTVAEFGNATKFRLGKTEVLCKQEGTLENGAFTYKDLDISDPGSFFDKRKSESRSAGFEFETKSQLEGDVDADDNSWGGLLSLKTKVFERGEMIDVCKLNTTWDVS